MPAKKRPKPLYQRGKYALHARPDRAALEIVWYDEERKRERSVSARTSDVREGSKALDRRYLNDTGERLCPTCHRPWDNEHSPTVLMAITDYLLLMEGRKGYNAAKFRLAHIFDYLEATKPETVCAEVTEDWIKAFRAWAIKRPVVSPKSKIERPRSHAHVEGSVMQLAAAINKVEGQKAKFTAEQQIKLSQSPTFRASVAQIAAMFNHCLHPEGSEKEAEMARKARASLLAYLRLAVATWGRPEAILEVKRDQWHSAARVLDLKPRGERQTDKRRPMLPMPRQIVPWLDGMNELWIPHATIRNAWDKMRKRLDLPGNGEAGPKLIRRSMATLVRLRIGESNWPQGEIWLGHVEMKISDIYAIPDPANLGLALAGTESIIDEIEALAPGAYRKLTAVAPTISLAGANTNG